MPRRFAEKTGKLTICFKNQYDYIGMLSTRKEKLAENLRLEKKILNCLYKSKNPYFMVEMEMYHRIQIQNDNHELTYQLKEEKAINADQAEKLKRQKEINQALEVEIKN